MFVDRIRIHAKAGDGGNGCVSFRREKFVPKGGPDGGDGGPGGDIYMVPDPHTDNLVEFYYQPLLRAKRGAHGMGKNMQGKAGKNATYKVPVGTIIYRIPEEKIKRSPPPDEEDVPRRSDPILPRDCELVADLFQPEEAYLLCRGGVGGKGNTHFKSSRNRVPRQFTEGAAGEEGDFLLELRTIADAGLIGYPNAGKSTLLSRISAARPKVAAYPFTTLTPMVGVVELENFQRLTVADVPGLIEGAHHNAGLGHEFLRHIARCRVLVFVLDIAGSEGRNPIEDLGSLRRELDLYDRSLSTRPWIIAANKMDLPEAEENLAILRRREPNRKIVAVAALEGRGIAELKEALRAILSAAST
jgi:GTPase